MEKIELDRRTLLSRAGGLAAASVLPPIFASCAPSGSMRTKEDASGTNPAAQSASYDPWAEMMTLALRFEYFGSQFYALATTGSAAASDRFGRSFGNGIVKGGHAVAFADPLLEQHASELAADKIAHVAGLRDQLHSTPLTWPNISFDFSEATPFSEIAQRAGFLGSSETFDPFADDASFLLGAFLLEDGMAAAYRGMIDGGPTPTPRIVTSNLADSIFDGGLIRSLIASKAEPGSKLALSMAAISRFIGHLDGSDLAGASPANGNDQVMTIEDSSGNAIPITRMLSQFGTGPSLLIATHP